LQSASRHAKYPTKPQLSDHPELALPAPLVAYRGCGDLVDRLKGMVTVEEVHDALREVIDPELGLDFVELGLIYGVDIGDAGAIKVTYTLTTPGCPIGPQVEGQMQEFVSEIEGVSSVESELVFTPPWSPDLMSDDAKFALGF
jgi:metal-sulfur cluster biosynthetic enzyme